MKRYIKYIISSLSFFITVFILSYLFNINIDIKISVVATSIYLILNILGDFIFKNKNK